MDGISAIIMAAGKGTRMNSDMPKVLHPVGDQPMIFHFLHTLGRLRVRPYIVVSHKANEVIAAVESKFEATFVDQGAPLGTGHAVERALEKVPETETCVLVVGGDDSAFYKPETIEELVEAHKKSNAVISMVTLTYPFPPTVAKVERDTNGQFSRIVEKSDPLWEGVDSREINCGMYVLDTKWLRENIGKIEMNAKGERYLTDLLPMAKAQGQKINLFILEDNDEWIGINTAEELARANAVMATRMVQK